MNLKEEKILRDLLGALFDLTRYVRDPGSNMEMIPYVEKQLYSAKAALDEERLRRNSGVVSADDIHTYD